MLVVVGGQQVEHIVACLARDSRKNNACVFDVSQNPGDLLAAGIANLIGVAFAFRTEEHKERAATLKLLSLPCGAGHQQVLAGLSAWPGRARG